MPPTLPVLAPGTPIERDMLELLREYVAGGEQLAVWRDRQTVALPWSLDDLRTDFGDDIYDRMLNDSQVAACAAVLKTAIIEDGINIISAVKGKDEDGFAKAKEIADEAIPMLEALSVPADDVWWDLLNAMFYGYGVAEQIFELRDGVTKKNKSKKLLQLAKLKVKPRRSVAFVVDAYLNVKGLIGREPNGQFPSLTNIDPAKVISREKFAILTFRPKNGDPRGTSLLRSAFDPWWRKRQTHVELLKYLTQFASPSIWATAPEKAKATTQEVPDPDNPGQMIRQIITVEEALLRMLEQFKNGTVAALPFGTELHTIQSTGEGRAFFAAIGQADQDITRAMLTQELATTSGQFQTRAASQVHQDVLDTIVRAGKHMLARMVARDVLTPWVRYNWGDDCATLAPRVNFGETEAQDRATLINAIANLYRAGYIDDSQLIAIDEALGLPPRDPESLLEPTDGLPGLPPSAGLPPAGQGGSAQGEGGGTPAPPSPQQRGNGNQGAGGHTGFKAPEPTATETIQTADIEAATDHWERTAPRRYRGLMDAEVV